MMSSMDSKIKPVANSFKSHGGKPARSRSPGDGLSQPTKRFKQSFAATVPEGKGETIQIQGKRQTFRPTFNKLNTTKTVLGKSIEKDRYRSRPGCSSSSSAHGLARQLGTTTATAGSGCKPMAVKPFNGKSSRNDVSGKKISRFPADHNMNKATAMDKQRTTLKTPLSMKNTAAVKLKSPSTGGRLKPMTTTLRMKTPSKQNANSEKISHKFTKTSCYKQRQSDPKSAIKALEVHGQKSEDVQFKGILKKDSTSNNHHDNHEIVPDTTSKHVKFKKSEDVRQASLRAKLNDWLQAKGKTPGHCHHLICFDAQMSAERKKPKPVYGRLSGDVLDMQENSLKKEEVNSRKRLFEGCKTVTPSKAPLVKQMTPRTSSAKKNRKSEGETHVLTPSDIANKTSAKSQVKAPNPIAEEDNYNENHCVTVSCPPTDDLENTCHTPHQSSAGEHSPWKELTPPDKKILDNLNSMLQECLTLFKDGCSLQNILPWLHEIETSIPQARTFAPYYICKAEVLRGNPSQILNVLCQAVERNAQPADVLSRAMRDLLSPYCASFQASPLSPVPIRMIHTMPQKTNDMSDQEENSISVASQYHTPAVQQQNHVVCEDDLGSTVKYCVTPGRLLPGQTPESVPLAKVTPIRRSLRLSNRQQTPFRKELESMSDLTLREAESTVYQPNPALLN